MTNFIALKNIYILDAGTKKGALSELVNKTAATADLSNPEQIITAVMHREKLMSTGIGLGIGIPHIRSDLTIEPVISMGVCRNTLPDYDSIDGIPVNIIVLIITGIGQHREHIRILSSIISKLKNESIRNNLTNTLSPDSIFKVLETAT